MRPEFIKERLYESACATAAIADLIKNVDLEKLEEYTMNHLSYVLDHIASETFEIYYGIELTTKETSNAEKDN